jgi:5'-nucleotidase
MRCFFWLLPLLFLLSCAHTPADQPDPARFDELVIVGTNDFHGYLRPVPTRVGDETVVQGGAEWFASYVQALEKKFGDHLILLDGGDLFQGTLESNRFRGRPVVEFYNRLPYRATAVGNHEFDYGPVKKGGADLLGTLKERMQEANFPFLAANIFWKKNGQAWREKNLYPSTLISAGGYKVGIIGLTTVSTPGKTLPKNVAALEFRDFVQPTLEEAKKLRAQGADFVLITTHEGHEDPGGEIYNFLHALPPGTVDAVVSGHSHTEIHTMVAGVPVIQSKTRGLYFGRIDLFVNKATRKIEPSLTRIHGMHSICGTWFKNLEDCDAQKALAQIAAGLAKPESFLPLRPPVYEGETIHADLGVRALLATYFSETDRLRAEKLGEAKAEFHWGSLEEKVELGGLFTDVLLAHFPHARVAYVNGGGLRRPIPKGPITYGDIYEASPFDNFAVEVKLSGRQFKDLVRVGVSGAQSIPSCQGVKVVYHRSEAPRFERDVNGDGKMEKWERDRLVSVVWEKTGKPVRDDEEFWVATNSYLAEGGDHTEHVFGRIPRDRFHYAETVEHDLVAEYLRNHPGIDLPRHYERHFEAIP